MKRYLITGGAGFLGSHLCKTLINRGDSVICLDDFSTGSFSNIKDLVGNKNFTLLVANTIFSLPKIGEVDGIFNLACPASPKQYQTNPINTFKTNVLGAINVLELAKELSVPILQTSTSEVYGDPDRDVLSEEYNGNVNPIGPRSCYDEGKRAAETLFMDYHLCHGVDIRIVRIFNTYGPKMLVDDGRVISNFINQALRDEPITIYGDGLQTRSFCYVDDQIKGILKAFSTKYHLPINIGNPEEKTIIDTANIIKEKIGSKSNIIFKSLPKDDPKKRFPNITKAKNILGWEPEINFNEGLDKTICYFETLRKDTV
jgi:UDP-glucuronate decarboxylase